MLSGKYPDRATLMEGTGDDLVKSFYLGCLEYLTLPSDYHFYDKKMESYELPSDDDMLMQAVAQMICEVCMFNEHCYMGMCIANEEWREGMRKTLFNAAKGNK